MEHTADDTAKAILALDADGGIATYYVRDYCIEIPDEIEVADLQILAKLWTMREELHEAIKAAYRFDDGCYSGYPDTEADRVKVTDALAKLAELEK